MVYSETGGNAESIDSQEQSMEQIASKKFEKILSKFKDLKDGKRNMSYYDGDGVKISLMSLDGDDIMIEKHDSSNKKDYPFYQLKKKSDWNFVLRVGKEYFAKRDKEIDNLTAKELLTDVLPNFERRLRELEEYNREKRASDIKQAALYAQAQDQKEAWELLDRIENMA